jgi:S-formylglutathione hydrolase FrmB
MPWFLADGQQWTWRRAVDNNDAPPASRDEEGDRFMDLAGQPGQIESLRTCSFRHTRLTPPGAGALKFCMAILLALFPSCSSALAERRCQFNITVKLAPGLAKEGTSGRLLIFMSSKAESPLHPEWDSDPADLWIAAKEVAHLGDGESVALDADELAFPGPFSQAPAGDYRIRAVLDTNHTYAYTEEDDDGDLISEVSTQHLPVSNIALTLSKRMTEPPMKAPHAELLDFESKLLSDFWGRPIHVRGLVVLPPSYEKNRSRKYPALCWTSGFGGTLNKIAAYELQYYYPYMERHERPEMIYVLLDQSCAFGTHEFANSANNGPWGDALVKELIPALERKYRMDAKPSGRQLLGQSSGGWAAMWLQVAYPDVFGGAWATAPDPVDFRAFIPVDLSTAKNIYRTPDGKRTMVMRFNGKEISLEDDARREVVLGEYGGQLGSFEAVFSPRGADGRPMRLFDRVTGEIDPAVAKAWQRYDIARILRENWRTLGPKLNGKIHLYVGTADNFYLDEPARRLEQTIKELGGKAEFVFLPGRTHSQVYDNGVAEKMWQEMSDTARPRKP